MEAAEPSHREVTRGGGRQGSRWATQRQPRGSEREGEHGSTIDTATNESKKRGLQVSEKYSGLNNRRNLFECCPEFNAIGIFLFFFVCASRIVFDYP